MSIADVCDLAHAVLVQRWEDDARAATAGGRRDDPVESARAELEQRLGQGLSAASRRSPEERDLREALGVA